LRAFKSFMQFISTVAMILAALVSSRCSQAAGQIRVVVWDERQPAQKQAYENFLGNHLADFLRGIKKNNKAEFDVKSVGLDDPDQGLSKEVLDNCDVLLWWGHQRHGEVKDELANDIVKRIRSGKLMLFAIHSAHWSKPFRYSMEARSVDDAMKSLSAGERAKATVVTIPPDLRLMERNEKMTPYWTKAAGANGEIKLTVKLPSCVFPFVAAEGNPGHITTLMPEHPIAKGVPASFDIPQTECYGGPFHVPTPNARIFEEKWDNGESFPSGSVWKLGRGTIFYYRPGHETYRVFKQTENLRIVENATRWLGSQKR
jgi:trehalose utilization protein